MRSRRSSLAVAFSMLIVLFQSSFLIGCASQTMSRGLNDEPVGVAAPVAEAEEPGELDLRRDGPFAFAGQPSPEALLQLKDEGYAMVINLRTDEEMNERVDFDERSLARELEIDYVQIPMNADLFTAQTVDRFAEALARTEGPVLVHCGSSNRAGALWASYLHRKRGLSEQEAIERGEAAGLSDRPRTREALQRVLDAPGR